MTEQAASPVTTEIIETDGRDVMLISIDDGKANAFSMSIIDAVNSAIAQAEADDTIGAAVIAGRPGRFSGGFDLSVMQSGDFSALVNLASSGGEMIANCYGAKIPVVAACTGHAMAAGAMALMGCDLRVGAAGAYKIGLNEVAIGMVLPGWAIAIARDRLPASHFQRCCINARILDPEGAVEAGFLDIVVEDDEVVARAVAEATVLATLDPRAYAKSVEVIRGATVGEMHEHVASDRAAVA